MMNFTLFNPELLRLCHTSLTELFDSAGSGESLEEAPREACRLLDTLYPVDEASDSITLIFYAQPEGEEDGIRFRTEYEAYKKAQARAGEPLFCRLVQQADKPENASGIAPQEAQTINCELLICTDCGSISDPAAGEGIEKCCPECGSRSGR